MVWDRSFKRLLLSLSLISALMATTWGFAEQRGQRRVPGNWDCLDTQNGCAAGAYNCRVYCDANGCTCTIWQE